MELISKPNTDRRRIASVGMYDGVHLGHRFLIDYLKIEASARELTPTVVTFFEHPASVVNPSQAPKRLSTPEERAYLLGDAGVCDVVILHFNDKMRHLTAKQFLAKLHKRYGIDALVVGFNNRFGHNRTDGIDQYHEIGKEIGLDIIAAPEYSGKYAPVSSSRIRQLISEGLIKEANQALGRPYSIRGTVITGNQIGRKLGYPTANVEPSDAEMQLPREGVYSALVRTSDGERHPAMLNIGRRPTINSGDGNAPISIEAHIHNFTGDIYGQAIEIEPIELIRQERRFPTLDKLTAQLKKDARKTKKIATDYLTNK